jgi:predicted RNase H-like HicB family nuclease
MEYSVVVYEAEEGGYWTKVLALPGCGSQGETLDEAIANTRRGY